jgi:hypothetical protein
MRHPRQDGAFSLGPSWEATSPPRLTGILRDRYFLLNSVPNPRVAGSIWIIRQPGQIANSQLPANG